MRILYVLEGEAPFSSFGAIGGRLAHVRGVVDGFAELGHEVVFMAAEPLPGAPTQYRKLAVRRRAIPKLGTLLAQLGTIAEVAGAVEDVGADLLYVRWEANVAFSLLRRRFPDLPIVVECNSPRAMHLLKHGRASLGRRIVARRHDLQYLSAATVVSAVSRDVRDFLLERYPSFDPERILVNPNGVNPARFDPAARERPDSIRVPEGAVVVGFAGYFSTWHGLEGAIQAIRELNRDDIHLVLCGSGSEEMERSLRAAAGTDNPRVIFTGPIPFCEMPAHLAACDILISPHVETIGDTMHGSPIKLFEYMAAGRAIIASRIGQIPEIIRDGETGLLCTVGSVPELSAAIGRLADDPALRARLGAEARADAVRSHSWTANVSRVLDAVEREMALRR